MKIYSKDAFTLGGLYIILEPLFTYIPLEIFDYLSSILFVFFIYLLLKILFGKTPAFIINLQTRNILVGHYLRAIGWIPYFCFIFYGGLIIPAYLVPDIINISEKQIQQTKWLVPVLIIFSWILVSLKLYFAKRAKN